MAGHYLGQADTLGLFDEGFARLVLSYGRGRLNVSLDSFPLLAVDTNLEVDNMRTWMYGFGARTGHNHDLHLLDNLTFSTTLKMKCFS